MPNYFNARGAGIAPPVSSARKYPAPNLTAWKHELTTKSVPSIYRGVPRGPSLLERLGGKNDLPAPRVLRRGLVYHG